jgi:hypothetical protein
MIEEREKILPYEHLLIPNLIDNIKQNKPSLIVNDLEAYGVPSNITMKILLGRGVCKWLAVRRKLIKLKYIWKDRIKRTVESIKLCKEDPILSYDLGFYRGYLAALEDCRKEVRELCRSSRWQVPDNDTRANNFLKELGG